MRGPANGEPLVLIPAQMGTWQSYAGVAASLSVDFEVFLVDVPGHGSSSWLTGQYSWSAVGERLAELLGRVVRRPAIVAGNSSGGILALWLAAERPELVSGIVLEDAPVFSVEWPRFRDRDRFVYQGLVRAYQVLSQPNRRLADYFRGAELPLSAKRVKRVPDWVIERIIDPGVRRWESRHPGEPSGFDAWWAPSSFGELFRALSMFDPDFSLAFIDGRMYGDFRHADALSAVKQPMLLMHGRWLRLEPYGLVGALDDEDVRRVCELAPQCVVRRFDVNHVVHRFARRGYTRAVRDWVRSVR